MKVLLSIKPEFVKKIFSGEKKYEYRRMIFKQKDIESIVIYCTQPIGKVVGEITFDEILNQEIDELWEKTKFNSGLSYSYYKEYFRDKDKGYAIKIDKLIPYNEPISLAEFDQSLHPPQSFCYLK
ncbi:MULTISPECIES: ASCH domain-containing protein [Rummeliibacillus]|uniref:ASCH domain-containing protein n=1 Tax=Rummeliibacillus TaxID=648802 RepID=UPI00371FD3EE